MRHILIGSGIYFAFVFFVGFVLGTVRVLLLVPAVGERYAELIEIPLMLIAIYYSALYVVNRYSEAGSLSAFTYIGIIALAILLMFEFIFVLGIRGISIEQYISSRDPVSGTAYVLSLLVYVAMPFMIAKSKSKKINA